MGKNLGDMFAWCSEYCGMSVGVVSHVVGLGKERGCTDVWWRM